jgi:class 3 adenylate cyclase
MERQYNQLLDSLKVTTSSAIAAEDIALLSDVVGQLGRSDSSLHRLDILNAEGRVLVNWLRPVGDNAQTLTLTDRFIVRHGKKQGRIRATIDLSSALVEVTTRTNATRLAMTLLLLILTMTVGTMIFRLALRPIAQIDKRLATLRKGTLRDDFEIDGAAEFRHIANALNGFARQIKERQTLDEAHRTELAELNLSYLRFVPKQFLEFLDHKSIIAVQHGDQVQRTMTVLFSDIRSFTGLSEQVGAQATFAFLNNFLSRIGPVIRNNNGFIDKYIGDAVMALFDSPTDAVAAAVEMLRELALINIERAENGETEIRIGIGINTGPLMLGIIGEDLRMEGTVIGDAVNLASRLEGLTKKYCVPLLVSEETLDAIKKTDDPETHESFLKDVRFVDAVTAKGRAEKTRVFEVFQADTKALRVLKRTHGATIERILAGRDSKNSLPSVDSNDDPLLPSYHDISISGVIDTVSADAPESDAEEEVRWS